MARFKSSVTLEYHYVIDNLIGYWVGWLVGWLVGCIEV